MSSEVSAKLQMMLWWIASIATSVVCCSLLFVLFASYLVGVRNSVMESEVRIALIEERSAQILAEVKMIREHAGLKAPANPSVAVQGEVPAVVAPDGAVVPAPSAVESAPAGAAATVTGTVEAPVLNQAPAVAGEPAPTAKKDEAPVVAVPNAAVGAPAPVPVDSKK